MDRFVDFGPSVTGQFDQPQSGSESGPNLVGLRARTRSVINEIFNGKNPDWRAYDDTSTGQPETQTLTDSLKIDLYQMASSTSQELQYLATQGMGKEIVSRLPPEVDLRRIDDIAARLLRFLIGQPGGEGLEKLHFFGLHEDISKDVAFFLNILLMKSKDVSRQFKGIKMIEHPSYGFRFLVVRLLHMGTVSEKLVLKKFVSYPNLAKISKESGELLSEMIVNGFYRRTLKLLPKTVDFTQMSDGFFVVMSALVRRGYLNPKDIIKRTVPLQSISDLTPEIDDFLDSIAEHVESLVAELMPKKRGLQLLKPGVGKSLARLVKQDPNIAKEFLAQTTDCFKLESMDHELSSLLEACVWAGESKKLLELLPDQIDISSLSIESVHLLIVLVKKGYASEVVVKCSGTQDLINMREDVGDLIALLYNKGFDSQVNSWFPESMDTHFFSLGMIKLLTVMSMPSRFELLKRVKLQEVAADLRQPINPDDLEPVLNTQKGWYLYQSLGLLGNKIFQAKKQPKGPFDGWYRAELHKDGSRTIVIPHVNEDGIIDQALFQNWSVKKSSMNALNIVHQFIPGFVSSSNYPELSDAERESNLRFRGTGFREVYAGTSLALFKNHNDQKDPVSQNILAQVIFIKEMLLFLGVTHGHTHDGNFNVRFLLIAPDGEKRLSFDANMAIQLAKDNGWTLVPIVVLRDWDQANIDSYMLHLLHQEFDFSEVEFSNDRARLANTTAALGKSAQKKNKRVISG